jgi:hypothetical protein
MPLAPLGPDHAIKTLQPMVEGLTEFNGKLLTSCLEFNREWTGFLMRRMQEDVSLVHDLAQCTEPRGVFEVYSTFFTRALSDYQSEYAQLATLNGKAFEQTTRALQGTLEPKPDRKAAAE